MKRAPDISAGARGRAPGTQKVRFITAVIAAVALAAGVLSFPNHGQAAASEARDVPAAVRSVLSEAARWMDRKEYARAVALLNEFIESGKPQPADSATDGDVHRHPMIYFALGNCYLLQEDRPQAEKAFLEVVRRCPQMAAAWLNLAKVCYDSGQADRAAQYFGEAYRRETVKRPEILYYSAVAYLLAKQAARSVAVFAQLFETHPTRIQPLWREHYVHALLADGEVARALPVIRELIGLLSGEARTRWQEILLKQYMQLRMVDEAARYTTALARETPTEPRWWKILGQIRTAAGDYEKALAALTIYSYVAPLSAEEKKLWADLSLQVGIPGQAAPIYAQLLKSKPDRQVLKSLVTACRRAGETEAALKYLQQSGVEGGDELLMLRADLLYSLKRYTEAEEAYRKAAHESNSVAGRAWLMAGYAAWQSNDIAASRQAFERAAGFTAQREAALAAVRQMQRVN